MLPERGATAGWNSYIRAQCFPCIQAGREGVLTSKSRGEMLLLSLALLVSHAKGLSFSVSASGHKQGHKQLEGSAYASRGKWREIHLPSTAPVGYWGGQGSQVNFGTGVLTKTFLDHFCRQRCSMTWYCGEGARGTGCLPDLLPEKCTT